MEIDGVNQREDNIELERFRKERFLEKTDSH